MRNLVCALCLFLAGCATPAGTFQAPAADRDTLRVVDINVWSGLDYTGYLVMGEYEDAATRERRYQALVARLRDLDPDIIGVHEANKLPDYIHRLAEDLRCDAVFHQGIGGLRAGPVGLPWNLREGDAILAKKDLGLTFIARRQLSGGYVGRFFTCHFEDATQVVAARIVLARTPVYLFSTHWHSSVLDTAAMRAAAAEMAVGGEERAAVTARVREGQRWRMGEAKKTLAFIRAVAGDAPVILMGDFNATEDTEEIRQLCASGLVDTFRRANPHAAGHTWAPRTNRNIQTHYTDPGMPADKDLYDRLYWLQDGIPARIDYIFAGPEKGFEDGTISVTSSRVVLDRVVGGVHASDHFGVMTEIVFP